MTLLRLGAVGGALCLVISILSGVLAKGRLSDPQTRTPLVLTLPARCLKPLFVWYEQSFGYDEIAQWVVQLSLSHEIVIPPSGVEPGCQVRVVVDRAGE